VGSFHGLAFSHHESLVVSGWHYMSDYFEKVNGNQTPLFD
jgi:hypothetical protein